MKQSRLMSMIETCLNTGVGFVVAIATQVLVFPLFGYSPPLSTNLKIGLIFTFVSIVRGYVLRRAFEFLHIRRRMSPFMLAAIAERFRQEDQEGWSQEHDDAHAKGELAAAGATYLLHAGTASATIPATWPWADGFNPKDVRRDLVRGVALGIAEGESWDRNRKRGRGR
jgi:hypothetical protein